ncbi:lysozyme C-1-like [Eucyclogobius newberryi]|uniref:lysozyme C-1-like n=1 Tax=Eucyclogobius newberryi TaxID=166745 RepID=UPI003B5C2199
MKLQSLVLLVLLCAVAQGKVFDRCEWYKFLKDNGMDGVGGGTLADWVCLTEHESNFNTQALNRNKKDKKNRIFTDYGILQISSKYWCTDGGPNVANGCNIACEKLFDPIEAIKCAKIVVKDPNGMKAWVAWKCRCQGQDLAKYVEG